MLGGDIGRHAGSTEQSGYRGGVDNGAVPLLQHHRQHMPHSEKYALQIDPNDCIENRLVIFLHRHDFALDAGIVEEAVDRIIGIERGLDVILHIDGFCDVGMDEASISATLTHKLGAGLAFSSIEINYHDLRAAPREAERGGAADTATAAGDQRNLAWEFHPAPPFLRISG